MSLTRDEWIDMWKICKELRHIIENENRLHSNVKRVMIESRIDLIERYIQQVIGQME